MSVKAAKSGTKKQAVARQPALPKLPSTPKNSVPVELIPRPTPAIVEPPFSCKLMWVKGVVRIVVNLQRVSEKCINFTPATDRFYLDTFKHTKKYKLDFVYPHTVKVDASAPEATLEAGILKTELKVVDWADAASQHAEIVAKHQNMLKTRGIKGVNENDDQKRKSSQGNESKEFHNPISEPAEPQKKTKKSKRAKVSKNVEGSVIAQPQKKEVPEPSVRKHNPPTSQPPQSFDAKNEPAQKPTKKKRFLGQSEMNEMLGKIVQAAESKSDTRLHRDETESSHLNEVIQSKKEKQENRKKRKLEARAILQKAIKRKKGKNKAESSDASKKVMFAT
jgi:hypothetical protein